MSSDPLARLAAAKQLKAEPPSRKEFEGLLRLGRTRLDGAQVSKLALEARFDLAYGAAHALSLAALRWHGYRSENRYLVFQCLPHTLGLGPSTGAYSRSATTGATQPSTAPNSMSTRS